MAIDKSLRQHYTVQGGRIGFQRGHHAAGMPGGTSSADRGGEAHKAAADKAQKAAAEERANAREKAIQIAAITKKTATKSPHRDTKEQIEEQIALDKKAQIEKDWKFQDVKAKPKVTTPKKAAGPFDYLQGPTPKTDTTTYHGKDDQVFTITRPKKYSPTYYQDRSKIGGQTWGERAREDVYGGFFDSGIGKIIKTIAPFVIPALLPTKLATPYSMFSKAKTISKYAKDLGLTEKDVMSTLSSNLTSKATDLTGKRSTTDTTDTRDDRDRGDGGSQALQKIAAPKADVVTESVQRFTQPQLTELQKRQSILQGYADKGALNERGQSTLMQLNQMLEQALASVAHGGRIDKPLMGRNRYI